MKAVQRNVMIFSTRNQIRYYDDMIRNLKMDASEYTKPNYNGEPPELTEIEKGEYDDIMKKVNKYEKLKAKEEAKLKKLLK